MIYPSIADLTRGKYNRYTLVIATSKCARMVTDEYVKQREVAERLLSSASTAESQKSIASMIRREYCDEKAVRTAISRLYSGEFKITDAPTIVKGEHLRDGFRKTIKGGVYGDDDELLSDDILEDEFVEDEAVIAVDDEIEPTYDDDGIIETLVEPEEET